jgi:hypothetical protein
MIWNPEFMHMHIVDIKTWSDQTSIVRWGVMRIFVNFNSCDFSTSQWSITKSSVTSSGKCNSKPDSDNCLSLSFEILNYLFDLLIIVDFAFGFRFSSSALANWSSTTFLVLSDNTISQSLINCSLHTFQGLLSNKELFVLKTCCQLQATLQTSANHGNMLVNSTQIIHFYLTGLCQGKIRLEVRIVCQSAEWMIDFHSQCSLKTWTRGIFFVLFRCNQQV